MKVLASTLAALALSVPVPAAAQSILVGLKAGLNQASWYGDFLIGSNPYRADIGPVAGATLAIGIREVVAVQVEALYSRKGATGSGGFRMDIGYLETPVLLKVSVPVTGIPFRPMLLAGVAPAWEIGCAAIAQPFFLQDLPASGAVPMSCSGWRSERHDLGRVLAGGVEVPVGRLRLTAELRRTSGRTNIAQALAPMSTYNEVWAFMVGGALALSRPGAAGH